MDPNRDSESRESSPSPPRRPNVRTSCDLCKRMKIKCERQGDTCVHCIDRGARCETTIVERKKRVVKRVDPGSIVEMEERINRLEAVIVAAGLEGRVKGESSGTASETTLPVANVTDRLSTLLIDEEGSSIFVGASSGLSLFSPQGFQWIAQKTGSPELPRFLKSLLKRLKKSLKNSPEINDFWSPMPRSAHEPPPPKHLADLYVQSFFETFNGVFLLYDRETFEQYYSQQYTATPPSGSAWYASFNVVIAIGGMVYQIHSRADRRSPQGEVEKFPNKQYTKYFRNAASCYLDLTFQEPSLLAVQAMCGLLNLEPHPSYMLTAAAGRMAYTIGLHRKLDHLDESSLTDAEINQRRNVFWVTYIMDKTLALRLGHPSGMNDNDIGVDLPTEHKSLFRYPDGSQGYEIFRLQVQLAMIESRIYTELYSSVGRKKSALERLKSVGEIDKALQDWRMTVPIEIRPNEFIQCNPIQVPPVLLMHFEFFNCLSTIHRVSIHHQGSWTHDDAAKTAQAPHNAQLNPRVYSSQSICLEAARSTIKLLRYVDVVDRFQDFIWTQMYFPLSAFLMLFANTLYNPEDPSTASDTELMDLVLSSLSPVIANTDALHAVASLHLFEELRNVIKKFMESNYRDQPRKTKREYDSDLPKDNFPSIVVGPQPTTPLPPSQIVPSQGYMAQSNMAQQPPYATPQQYAQPQFNSYMDGSFVPDSQAMLTDQASFPTLGFDAFMFSENFEWDLANLWKQDYSPGSQ